MQPWMIHTRHFPWRGFHALTLFPVVFYRDGELSQEEVRHETVHLWQQAALLLVGFYVLYFVFWLIGLLRYRNSDRAYREIPFERSAYILESESDVNPARQSYHWITCIIRSS